MWLNTIYVGDGFHVPIYPTSGSGTGDPSRDRKPVPYKFASFTNRDLRRSCMLLNKNKISEIIGESKRFCSPYDEPESYYIVGGEIEKIDNQLINLYYEKLAYAVCNADDLIESTFDNNFYNFYGVNRNIVKSPNEMSSQLYFDSFVLDVEHNSIVACLSNNRFMSGHFIEVWWNRNWKITSQWID